MISPLIQARLTQLILTSLYEDDGRGTLRLIEHIDLQKEPWFWPPVVEISCKQKKYPEVYPPWGGQHLRFPVQPKTPPSRWVNVVDQTEDGKTILVGRIPVWDEFWSGSPPTSLRSEIPHAEVDAFLGSMMQGTASSTKAFFEQKQTQLQSLLPPKTMFGFNIPVGPIASGPRGQDPRGPLDPRRPDTGPDIRPGDSSNCWERICCIGLDVEKREVTAIVELTQSSGYGGDLCSSSAFESVGFWFIEPSRAELVPNEWQQNPNPNPNSTRAGDPCGGQVRFIGAKRIPVADIPRNEKGNAECLNPLFQYDAGSLRYSVSLPLTDDDLDLMKKCNDASPRLPVLHAVVAWNVDVKNENFGGRGLRFGDWDSEVVQYPVLSPAPIIRQMAVGAWHNECPNVRYSNLLRTFEGKAIDTLAISITPSMMDSLIEHSVMQIVCMRADIEPKLSRKVRIGEVMINKRSAPLFASSVPQSRIVRPFNLEPGSWIICAVFSDSSEAIDWDPQRDIVLIANGPGNTITCIGGLDELKMTGLKVASAKITMGHLMEGKTFRKNDFGYTNYPPCVLAPTIEAYPKPFEKTFEVGVHYPVRLGDTETPTNREQVGKEPSIFVLVPANGIEQTPGAAGRSYKELIEQMCLQGAIVVVLGGRDTGSTFFLIDYLPDVLREVERVFSLPSSAPVFLFGHSMGGGQVAQALTNEDLPESDPRQVVRKRIAAGVLLAPTLWGDELHMDVAPVLVMYGPLDSHGPPFRVRCSTKGGSPLNTFSEFIMSPLRLYENSEALMRAMVFVDGATHFRWIQHVDDYGSVSSYQNLLERRLVLDGDFEQQGGYLYKYHDLILRSYVSYFYRVWARYEPNFAQCFINPSFQIPELSVGPIQWDIVDQIHRYVNSSSRKWINKTSDVRSTYGYRGVGVKRSVTSDGAIQSAANGGLNVTTTLLAVRDQSIPIFEQDLIVTFGKHVEYRFDFTPWFVASSSDILYSQFSILNIDGSLYPGNVVLSLTIGLTDDKSATFVIDDVLLKRRDVVLSSFTGTGDTRVTTGDMHTVEEVHVPLAWFVARCFGMDAIDGSLKISSLMIAIVADDTIQIGLGKVGSISFSEITP